MVSRAYIGTELAKEATESTFLCVLSLDIRLKVKFISYLVQLE